MVAGRGCRKTQLWLERKYLWTSSEQKAAQHKSLTEMLWNLFIFFVILFGAKITGEAK